MHKFTAELGERALSAYTRSIFGKVSKSELDLLAFAAFVKQRKIGESQLWRSDGALNWLRLDSGEIFDL
jgi:hypothetical protein